MSQATRLFRICRRLSTGQTVTVQSLQEELEVARATIFRDIAVLRDQLAAPIEWDAQAETYRLNSRPPSVGDRFVVPGMHMSAGEVYGMLTVLNVASTLDPGCAALYFREFRGLLKQMMRVHEIKGYGLDRKIVVELPAPSPDAQMAMHAIGPALVKDTHVRLFAPGLSETESLLVVPERLRLRAEGWWLDYRAVDSGATGTLLVADIVGAEAAD